MAGSTPAIFIIHKVLRLILQLVNNLGFVGN